MKRIVFISLLLVAALSAYAVAQVGGLAGFYSALDKSTKSTNIYTIADAADADTTAWIRPAEYTYAYATAVGDSSVVKILFMAGIITDSDYSNVVQVDSLEISAAGNYLTRVDSLPPYPGLYAILQSGTDNGHATSVTLHWGRTGRLAGTVAE